MPVLQEKLPYIFSQKVLGQGLIVFGSSSSVSHTMPSYFLHSFTQHSLWHQLTRPIIERYVPADQVERSVQMVGNDPSRVLVVLHPEKIVTN